MDDDRAPPSTPAGRKQLEDLSTLIDRDRVLAGITVGHTRIALALERARSASEAISSTTRSARGCCARIGNLKSIAHDAESSRRTIASRSDAGEGLQKVQALRG